MCNVGAFSFLNCGEIIIIHFCFLFSEGLLVLFQGEVLNGNTAKVIEGEQMNLTCLEKSNNKSDDTVWDGRDLPASFKDIKDQHQFTIPKVDRSYSDDYRCTFKLPGIKYAAYPPRIITVEVLCEFHHNVNNNKNNCIFEFSYTRCSSRWVKGIRH